MNEIYEMKEIENHIELTDLEFENQFSDYSLNPKLFTHEAHIRLAWIHITKYGLQQAELNINSQILKYVTALNAQAKYNATVTIAGIKVVNHFILHSASKDFGQFKKENTRLFTDFKGLLMTHYKTNIFESSEAKNKFIEPDLMPFD